MQYKIVNLRVKNFKCFDNAQFYEFRIEYEKNPIILSGPNGFGKTTFFDAIELIFSKNITRLDNRYGGYVFRINIPLDRIAADEATEQKTLSEREQKIYNMICENLHLSVEQVMAELDISRSTVFRDYAKIKKVTGAAYDKKTSTWTL